MAFIKHDIPILEYDDNRNAVFMPNRGDLYSFPERAVFAFLADEVDKYATLHGCEEIAEFPSITKTYVVYKTVHKGHEIALCQAPVGAAPAAQLLDFLIGYGARSIISGGCCGALTALDENVFLIPTEALRCEGTSYHYLPPSRTVSLNTDAIAAIQRALDKNSMAYSMCKTWSTDGFYRETPDMVEYRRSEGYNVVDMECSALAAVAQFRGATFGQMLFTADTLHNVEAYDERGWGLDSFPVALQLCLDAVVEL